MKIFSLDLLKKEFNRIRWPHAKSDRNNHEKGYIPTFVEVLGIVISFALFFVLCDALLSLILKKVTFNTTPNRFMTISLLIISSFSIIVTLLQMDKADSFQNIFGTSSQLNLFANAKERGADKIIPTATWIILFLFILTGLLSLVIGG